MQPRAIAIVLFRGSFAPIDSRVKLENRLASDQKVRTTRLFRSRSDNLIAPKYLYTRTRYRTVLKVLAATRRFACLFAVRSSVRSSRRYLWRVFWERLFWAHSDTARSIVLIGHKRKGSVSVSLSVHIHVVSNRANRVKLGAKSTTERRKANRCFSQLAVTNACERPGGRHRHGSGSQTYTKPLVRIASVI